MTQTATLAVNRIILGDAATTMMTLQDDAISCITTSPPFYGMRLYSGSEQTQALGGNPHCGHEWTAHDSGEFCHVCSAWRGALGLEPLVELYVEHLVEIFRIARRKLRSDGVFYLNVGDCFCGSGSPGGDFRSGGKGDDYLRPYNRSGDGLNPKDLCLVPWKLIAALQEDGWYIRDCIVWLKRSRKPDSATDRRSNTWEPVFQLTKSANYWYDGEAVREPNSPQSDCEGGRNARNVIVANPEPLGYQLCNKCKKIYDRREYGGLETVTIPSKNYSGGLTRPNSGSVGERAHKEHTSKRCVCGAIDWLTHSATFPQALVEELVLAGCPPWICRSCGKPRARLTRKIGDEHSERRVTVGWSDCGCGAGFTPGIVLDCFAGSGTSPLVAENLGRDWLAVEVSEDYCRLADRRISQERRRPPTPITELPRPKGGMPQ